MISIRRQLTRRLLIASLLLVAGGLLTMYVAAHIALLRQFDDALRAKASAISTLTTREGGEVRVAFSDRFLRGFDDDRARDFFTLWDGKGRRLARSESLRRRELPRVDDDLDDPRFWNLTLPNGRPGRAVALSFTPRRVGPASARDGEDEVQLVVASDRRQLDETLLGLLGLAAGSGALLLGVTWLIVPRVLRRGLRPLEQLAEQASRIDAGSLTARFPVGNLPAELQPIAGRLNDLLHRLEQSFERERRFSADLAHELRTPLAELRSLAECALKWPETRDPALERETLAIALQMEALVTSMLTLARGEQDQLASRNEPVALAPVVERAWETFAPRAAERRLNVTFDLTPATAPANPALLRAVLNNLLENAVDYTPAGGDLSVSLRTHGEQLELTIANTTDNLAVADVERIFDRFWRKEAARTGGRHFGLGLPLAATGAAAMGWKLTATLDESHVLRLTLSCALSRVVG